VAEIIGSHQKFMLSIATNIEQTKRDTKEKKLKELNNKLKEIEQYHMLNYMQRDIQRNNQSKKKARHSNVKVVKEEELSAMKNEYLSDKLKRGQLRKLIKVESEEEFKKNLTGIQS
jgi:hypothetical protein